MRKAGVITVSDRAARGEREDTSGPLVCARLETVGFHVFWYQILPDEPRRLLKTLEAMAEQDIELVVTTGGTGIGPRDRVPDTLRSWADGELPGFGERMRVAGGEGQPRAALSRGGAWFRRGMLVVALPGSPRGAGDGFDAISSLLHHALDVLAGADHSPSASAEAT